MIGYGFGLAALQQQQREQYDLARQQGMAGLGGLGGQGQARQDAYDSLRYSLTNRMVDNASLCVTDPSNNAKDSKDFKTELQDDVDDWLKDVNIA
jgi:hypothetical protein